MSDVFISYSRIDACRNDPTSGRGDQDNVLDDTFARGFKVKPNKDSSGLPGVTSPSMLAVWVSAPMSGPIRNMVSSATTYYRACAGRRLTTRDR